MAEACIVAAVRTAAGRRQGRLSGWHPVDLAAQVLDALLERSGIDPAAVDASEVNEAFASGKTTATSP